MSAEVPRLDQNGKRNTNPVRRRPSQNQTRGPKACSQWMRPSWACQSPAPSPRTPRTSASRGRARVRRRAPASLPATSRATEPADLDDEGLLDLITERGAALCRKYGGLRAALGRSDVDLARDGVGASDRIRLRAALEIGQRFITATINRGAFLISPAASQNAIMGRLRDRKHEVFAVLFLTNRHQVIAYEEMFRGTLDGASVYPREVAVRCLEVNAAAIIMAHNHPSGVAEPSASDRLITTRIRDALELIAVRVLDQFVIGDGDAVSFAERGWL